MTLRRMQPHAFTLVELLIAASIAIVLAGALFVTTRTGERTYTSMDTSIQAQEQVWRTFDQMRELERSGTPNTQVKVVNVTTLDFQLPDNTTGTIRWGAFDKNGQFLYDATVGSMYYVQYRYNAGTKQLEREVRKGDQLTGSSTGAVPGESVRILANYVDIVAAPTIFELSGNVVKIHLCITTPTNKALPGGGTRTSGLQHTQFQLRNSP